jgi:hypothetical protein
MRHVSCAAVLLFVSTLAAPSFGQALTGTISGRVTDPDGTAVPAAVAQATNSAAGTLYKTRSAADGSFTLARLPAGTYDITIPPIGFTFPKYQQKGVSVHAGQTVRVDIRLQWGINLGTPGDDFTYIRRSNPPAGRPPRTRDGHPDLSGVWLGNAPDRDQAELSRWAEGVTNERIKSSGAGRPGDSCLPSDISLTAPLIYRVIQTPAIIAILWEGGTSPNFVQIFTDGRRHSGDSFPTWMGESIGRWDVDTLVVDTTGFNDRSWLGFYPHTEMLHMVQRYRRLDAGHIEKEVTFEDPGTFTKPWKTRQTWELVPGEEVHEYICNENERDAQHLKVK